MHALGEYSTSSAFAWDYQMEQQPRCKISNGQRHGGVSVLGNSTELEIQICLGNSLSNEEALLPSNLD